MEKFNCKKIVFSSSATIYGNNGEYSNLKEDTNAEPINPYGETKIIIEKILQNLYLSSNSWSVSILNILTYRSASIWRWRKPLDAPNNIFPIINDVASGQRKKLIIYGNDWDTYDGTGVRDYIHVMDLADGHISVLSTYSKIMEK